MTAPLLSISPGPVAHSLRGSKYARRAVLVLLAVAMGVDWWTPLQGLLSLALLSGITLLVLLWAVLHLRTVRAQPTAELAPAALQRLRDSRRRALFLNVCLQGLVFGFVVAKWLVQLRSAGNEEDFVQSAQTYTLALALVVLLGAMSGGMGLSRFLATVSEHPARLMATSFGGLGLLGALLLSLPWSVYSVSRVSLVDSVFMAFSAVCITGLSVHNVAEVYTPFGQGVLLLLVQVGGLGIMVLSAAIVVLAGQRLRVRSSAVLTEIVDGVSLASLRRTVLMICAYTLLIEGVGTGLLYVQLREHPEVATFFGHPLSGAGSALWAAAFHAISAFCNAGFSNLSTGLLPLSEHSGILLVIAVLVVLGGIGFPVLDELACAAFRKLRGRKLTAFSLHTRITLRASALLLGFMAVAYLSLEWASSFAELSYFDRLIAAVFQSVSARTAGFNVVDISAMLPATLVLTCAAMFVGAAPGSTGGGIKITTLSVLYAGLRAELRSRPPQLLNRALPDGVIRKAIGVVFLSLLIVFVGFFLLVLLEPHPPLELLFEVISAFSTTGLTAGVTSTLSVPGKLLIALMMFVGRIGPLTVALALSVKTEHRPVRLPAERVMIG